MSNILDFGKHNGKSIAEVYAADKNYSRWLLNQELLLSDKPEIKEFLSEKFDANDSSFLLTWGKHKNKTIKWIFDNDNQYFKWMSKNEYIKDKCKKLFGEIQDLTKSTN